MIGGDEHLHPFAQFCDAIRWRVFGNNNGGQIGKFIADQLCSQRRARLWIPYAAMPIGLALLSLQALADLADLLQGRAAPFGIVAERTS